MQPGGSKLITSSVNPPTLDTHQPKYRLNKRLSSYKPYAKVTKIVHQAVPAGASCTTRDGNYGYRPYEYVWKQ